MKQHLFEQRYQQQWQLFEQQLILLEQSHWRQKKSAAVCQDNFPAAYRRICTQLAMARERHYSNRLINQLSQLAWRGYQQLYRAPRGRWAAVLNFIGAEFPCLVRQEAKLFWLASALFYLPLLIMVLLVYVMPELIFSLLEPAQLDNFDAMYQPGSRIRDERSGDSDVLMFGFYIYNNIGIGFRTFASGIIFAIGAVFILVFNGTYIGAIAGYVTERGYIDTFYPFVIGHSSFELTGIVLAGVAGLKLGLALLAPGRYSRLQALKLAAQTSIKIVYGVIVLLLLAAFIEAFWSSNDHLPLSVRYAVGSAGWLLLTGYLLGAGRRAA